MASIPPLPEHPAFMTAIEETLSSRIMAVLKEPLMKIAEEQVDLAVADAMKYLDVKIAAWVKHENMETIIKIVFDDKRKGTPE